MTPAHNDLRGSVRDLLDGGYAHARAEQVLRDFPRELRGKKPPGAPHTPWQILEHLRICQRDILDTCTDPGHRSPKFPEGFWPASEAPTDDAAWDGSVRAFLADLAAVRELISDSARDPLAALPRAPDTTVLDEALLVADHNAYHLGQVVLLRRMLGAWNEQTPPPA